ncbi:phosphate ABC transporter, ATP-binding protein [Candidatus Methanoperedens nitroreducens]|uniref:Phosphate ABC transporter, ATP-binding protein n=1 Tax=Candidatus Methanoperedens nitratireducens TaxID=1392998 RepID=A0A062UYK7_9EURY|nr:phosphate ABC transporter, ATP-binding protein [Candidatus Methanoperedens nitroreducens]
MENLSLKNHISIQDLNAFYSGHHALRDITVEIPQKQITAIIGPSGCGKSTFLKCFNRLIDLTDGARASGKIIVGGIDVLDGSIDITDVRRRMGLLPQKPNPLPMSIYDNVTYGPRIHGIKDKKRLDGIVEKYLKIAGLWDEVKDRLKSPASKLSIGQQQRLCLARGLAVEPEIILCDEPTSALDPLSAQHIEQQLLKLKNDYTIVIVTHNIHQAMRLADYVVHLYLGELVEYGPASEVFKNPKEERTRAYINGTFLADLKTDAEINLKGNVCPYNFMYAKQALHDLSNGKLLKVVVDYPTAVTEVPRGMEADGHKVLSVKQINKTDWEIVIQK